MQYCFTQDTRCIPRRHVDRHRNPKILSIDLHFVSHLFGGSLSGHVQSTAADGGGSRCKGSGRADKEGGNSELHVVKGMNPKRVSLSKADVRRRVEVFFFDCCVLHSMGACVGNDVSGWSMQYERTPFS